MIALLAGAGAMVGVIVLAVLIGKLGLLGAAFPAIMTGVVYVGVGVGVVVTVLQLLRAERNGG